jgi:flagellar basal-body rod protein FlgG
MLALRIAATGMAAQDLNVQVISNNIANMNTVGYKRQTAQFEDLLYQNLQREGTQSSNTGTVVPTGIQIGLGVKTGEVERINTQGSMTNTGNPLDMAISGRGYFQVLTPSGTIAYTRAGNFSVNATGQIVTQDGYLVQPTMVVPQNAKSVSVSSTGQVQITQDGVTNPTTIGQLQTALFFNEAGLDAQGGNLFLETAASGPPTLADPGQPGFGTIMQGYVEASNVDPVTEITNLITAQRAYEMNSKVITAADQMLQTTNQLQG